MPARQAVELRLARKRARGVRASRASLSHPWGSGAYCDPYPDGESRDDLSNGGKCICSAKATNILEVAMGVPRRSKSVYDAAPRQPGTPQALRQCSPRATTDCNVQRAFV